MIEGATRYSTLKVSIEGSWVGLVAWGIDWVLRGWVKEYVVCEW
jgi:hypothetical protein